MDSSTIFEEEAYLPPPDSPNSYERRVSSGVLAMISQRFQESVVSRGRSSSVPENLHGSVSISDVNSLMMSTYLDKQNPNGVLSMKGWKRRWFILDHMYLTYCKTHEAEPIKKISLQNIKSAQSTKDAIFEVATNIFMDNGKARTFVLRAETEDIARAWVAAIMANKAIFKKHMSDPDPNLRQKFCDSFRSMSSPGISSGHHSWSSVESGHGNGGGVTTANGNGGEPVMARSDSFARGLVLLPKKLVSRNKKRFEEDGFSLDLTYITPRVIAMGFPSEGMEGSFRNPVDEVYRFFETRHPDAYMIYNLCPPAERTYSHERFHHRVSSHPFLDHHPPPFEVMRPLCRSIERFLAQDETHVAAVHCKAGKGRTGVVIVSYLLHSGHCATPEEALWHYGNRRTCDGKGVTIPSQIRYCHYFAQNLGRSRPLRRLQLARIRVVDPPAGCLPVVARICSGGLDVTFNGQALTDRNCVELLVSGVVLAGDVEVTLVSKHAPQGRRETWNPFTAQADDLCSFWFHTSFVEGLTLRLDKHELDGAPRKDKTHDRFRPTFAVEVYFAGEVAGCADEQGARPDDPDNDTGITR